MDKNIAILELIEKCFFDALLVIDVPRDLKELLQLRSDNFYSLESVKIDNFEIINKKFDLIVSFSAHSKVIDILTEVYNKDSCEILIVCLESGSFNLKKFTYNPKSSELLNIQRKFINSVITRYYAFPNLNNPEMILTKEGLKDNYYRYWSWKVIHIKTLLNLIEFLFIRFFNVVIFPKNLIIKINISKHA